MAEPLRKDQELSTADLARTPERPRLVPDAPEGEVIGDERSDVEMRDAELRDAEVDDRRRDIDDDVLQHKPAVGVRDVNMRNFDRDIGEAERSRNISAIDAQRVS